MFAAVILLHLDETAQRTKGCVGVGEVDETQQCAAGDQLLLLCNVFSFFGGDAYCLLH